MSTPTLQVWQGTIDGLLFGPGTPYDLAELKGVGEDPAVRDSDEEYPNADGDFVGDDYYAARTITLSLEVMADAGVAYHDALAALRWATRAKRTVDLWLLLPGWSTPRRAAVRVRRRAIPTDTEFEMGLAHADFQLKAHDPVMYGPDTGDLVTGFAQPLGGLQYPLFTDGAGTDLGYLDYGAASTTGRLTVTNTGDTDVWPTYRVTGPVPDEGFELVRTDTRDRIRFEGPIAAGSSLALDSSDGTAVIDAIADRGGSLTYRDWFPVLAGESVEIAFVNLGAWSAAQVAVSAPPGWM